MITVLVLLISLCFAEFMHNAIEIWGMRQKVSWLSQSLDGKKHGKWPVHIDTKLKTLIFHVIILFIITGLSYVLLKWLNFTNGALVTLGIVILIINYIFTTWKVDKFHMEIGRLIKDAKKKSR